VFDATTGIVSNCSVAFGSPLALSSQSFDWPATQFAPGTLFTDKQQPDFANFICLGENIRGVFKANYNASREMYSQYIGSEKGGFIEYPGRRQWYQSYPTSTDPNALSCRVLVDRCDMYDPRYRPWYIQALSGPKNILLLLDTGSSMAQGDRLDTL
jgi:hypothetical protein